MLPERSAEVQGDVADNSVTQRIFAEKLERPEAAAPDKVSDVTPVTADLRPLADGTPLAQVTVRSAGHVAEQLAEPLIAASEYVAPGMLRNLRFKLRPAELGQVEVELRRDAAGRLSARLTVGHEATSRVLGDELGQLREALERAGLQVGRLDVTTYVGGHGPGWHTNGQSNQPITLRPRLSRAAPTPTLLRSNPISMAARKPLKTDS
jgi:flagellar hook-length control protein FliK